MFDKLTRQGIPNRPSFFLHIPKTAGSTFREHLMRVYRYNGICNIWGEKLSDVLKKKNPADCNVLMGHFALDEAEPILKDFFSICFLRDPRDRLISTYRFWASHKWDVIRKNNWWWLAAAKEKRIEDFFADPAVRRLEDVDNTISRYLTSRTYDEKSLEIDMDTLTTRAIGNLSKISFLGFQESFGADLVRLESELGVKIKEKDRVLKSSRPEEVTDENLEKINFKEPTSAEFDEIIEDLIKHDAKVVGYARRMRQAQLERTLAGT